MDLTKVVDASVKSLSLSVNSYATRMIGAHLHPSTVQTAHTLRTSGTQPPTHPNERRPALFFFPLLFFRFLFQQNWFYFGQIHPPKIGCWASRRIEVFLKIVFQASKITRYRYTANLRPTQSPNSRRHGPPGRGLCQKKPWQHRRRLRSNEDTTTFMVAKVRAEGW